MPKREKRDKKAKKDDEIPLSDEWDAEQLKVAGTDKQTMIMANYPSQTPKDKLKIPYIERQNGNLCIKCMKPDDTEEQIKASYRVAISYYNKALLALKMIFE